MRKLIVVAALFTTIGTASWGYLAIAQNADGSHLPLGPVGTSACQSAVDEAKANIPNVVTEAQNSVDSVVADDPSLAQYAASVKQAIADAAPGAAANLDDAGHSLGC